SDEKNVPVHWSATDNVCWKTPIPGKGHSSPVVWGDRIFLTTCLEQQQQRTLLCLDRRDGRTLWQRVVLRAPLEQKHFLNSFASSTPVTDGQHVWVTFLDVPRMEVFCYDFAGNLVWRRSPGEFHSVHGFCSSPILYKDLLIINGDQDAQAYIVALHKITGAERWRIDRPNRTRSYCTPAIFHVAGRDQLVLSGSKCVTSYDPDTGKLLWIIDGPTEQFVASPVSTEGIIFITGGFPEHHLIGIRPDGHGNVTHTHILWHDTRGASYVPSPIAHGHYFFVVSDEGRASCLDAKTGKRLWFQRLGRHHSASPVSADGRLYFLDDDGTMFVLAAGPKFKLIARNALREDCRASPALAHGQMFIRTLHNLYCIGQQAK
ncbi:MAG TPA: PQQ-binding-like beta-propeller repeat protein, partial [Gemmataceae bacterium]|nr:PQQ-binding-like beta-propeller repeat protein [Gemmataceae bacterium]